MLQSTLYILTYMVTLMGTCFFFYGNYWEMYIHSIIGNESYLRPLKIANFTSLSSRSPSGWGPLSLAAPPWGVSFVWRQASHSSWAPKMCHGRGKTLGKTSSHGEEAAWNRLERGLGSWKDSGVATNNHKWDYFMSLSIKKIQDHIMSLFIQSLFL